MKTNGKLVRTEIAGVADPLEYCGELLCFGENPLVLSECVKAVKRESKNLGVYPDANQKKLRKAIAKYCRVSKECVTAGNGSDELIEIIARTFVNRGDKIVVVEPCFPGYENACALMGGRVKKIALNPDFSLDEEALLREARNAKLVWIANPNNPTGNELLTPALFKKLVRATRGILVVDECYYEYCGATFAKPAARLERVIVLRSLSKAGLAGVRVGFAVGAPQTIRLLEKTRFATQKFSVNRFAQAAANAALETRSAMRKMLRKFAELKKDFSGELRKLGFEVVETKTSFVLLRRGDSQALFDALLRGGVRVKNCGNGLVTLGVPPAGKKRFVLNAFRKASKVVN